MINYRRLTKAKTIQLGDGKQTAVVGIGDLLVTTMTEGGIIKLFLKKLLYVPGLRHKLFSVYTATSKGNEGLITGEKFILKGPNNNILLEARRQGRLYIAQLSERGVKARHLTPILKPEGEISESLEADTAAPLSPPSSFDVMVPCNLMLLLSLKRLLITRPLTSLHRRSLQKFPSSELPK